jgi:hypothetical protein
MVVDALTVRKRSGKWSKRLQEPTLRTGKAYPPNLTITTTPLDQMRLGDRLYFGIDVDREQSGCGVHAIQQQQVPTPSSGANFE